MRIRHCLKLGLLAALLASCAQQVATFRPQIKAPAAPSVVPLVRISQAPANPFVHATVNGRPGLFLVDTGATNTCLDARFANAVGLQMQTPASGQIETNVTGGFKVAIVDSLVFGNHRFEKFAVAVINLDHVEKALGRRMDGMIGMNVLRTMRFAVDSSSGQIALGVGQPSVAPFALGLEQGGLSMPLTVNGLRIQMKIDTGASNTSITPANFANVLAIGAKSGTMRVPGAVDVNGYAASKDFRVLLAECKAGGLTRQNFMLRESQINLLGMDFFKDQVVTFDGTTGQAWITPAANRR